MLKEMRKNQEAKRQGKNCKACEAWDVIFKLCVISDDNECIQDYQKEEM